MLEIIWDTFLGRVAYFIKNFLYGSCLKSMIQKVHVFVYLIWGGAEEGSSTAYFLEEGREKT